MEGAKKHSRPNQFSVVLRNRYAVAIFVRAIIAIACVGLLLATPITVAGTELWFVSTLIPFILGSVGIYITMKKAWKRYRETQVTESIVWSVKWMALMNGWPIYGTMLAMIGFGASSILFFLSLAAIGFTVGITLGELCIVYRE